MAFGFGLGHGKSVFFFLGHVKGLVFVDEILEIRVLLGHSLLVIFHQVLALRSLFSLGFVLSLDSVQNRVNF